MLRVIAFTHGEKSNAMAVANEIADVRTRAVAAAEEKDAAADERFQRNRETWELIAYVSTVGLFALAVLGTLYLMRDVLVPIILAWVVANILLPIVTWMETKKVPRIVAVITVTLLLIVVLLSIIALFSLPMTYWLGRATELGTLLKQKMATLSEPLTFFRELMGSIGQVTSGTNGGPSFRVEGDSNIVGGIYAIVTPAVSQAILFLGALVFYLIYQKKIKARSVLILPSREARLTALRILSDIEKNTTVYFGTFTIVNICLGIVTTGLAWLVGLPNPMLWGLLAAIVNYVPYNRRRHHGGGAVCRRPVQFPHDPGRPHRPARLHRYHDHRRPLPDARHHGPQDDAQSFRRIPRHRLLDLDVGTHRRLRCSADADDHDRYFPPPLPHGTS